jgi:hypothetical protein
MAARQFARHRLFSMACGAASLCVVMTACAGDPEPPDEPPAADRRLEQRELRTHLPERVILPAPEGERSMPPEALLSQVLADAATRTGVAVADLVVAEAWRKVWSDGSLGCPRPGEYYTQALVPGWHVLVRAGPETLDYRLTERGYFALCEPDNARLRRHDEQVDPSGVPPRS